MPWDWQEYGLDALLLIALLLLAAIITPELWDAVTGLTAACWRRCGRIRPSFQVKRGWPQHG